MKIFLLNEPNFTNKFYNYISTSNLPNSITIEDIMRSYIRFNIKPRYIIKEVILWSKILSYNESDTNKFILDLNKEEKNK